MKKAFLVLLITLICSSFAFTQMGNSGPLLTSIGQSPDAELIRVLLTRQGIPFQLNPLATSADLRAADEILVLVIGGSSKGLGAAGISADDELARTRALITRARELNMQIIAVHIGGEDRRGALSDGFINYAVPLADQVIVVSTGNADGLFTSLAGGAGIPLQSVARINDVGTPLAAVLR